VSTTTAVMPFGKYKGTPLTEIDGGYLHWLASKLDEWHPPLREAIEAERARRKGAPAPSSQSALAETTPARARAPHQVAEACCAICGLRGTTERPLVHASCTADEVPF
jgi:hypothetical protein